MGIFQQLNRTHGITIIVVTHSDEVARFASRIITFRDGRIVDESRKQISHPDGAEAAGSYVPAEVSQ